MPTDSRTESELSLPKELLAALAQRNSARGGDFHIESWKPSLVARMFGFLDRGRSRE